MKIHIWIKKEDAISGNIKSWYTYPVTDYVQVSITQDKFARLNDQEYCQDNWNGGVEKINSMFDGVIHERNPDTGQVRSRKAGDYGNEVYHEPDKGDEDIDEGEHSDNIQFISEEEMDALEEQTKRDEQFYVDQYNRNRHHTEHVKSIDEIIKK